MTRFVRYALRTTDVPAARAFYNALLGESARELTVLPTEAVSRGARPHWLGHLGVTDVATSLRAFVARGATQLGPTRASEQGGEVALVRDPGGAVVALCSEPRQPTDNEVVWQVLNTPEPERAVENYCALFGWARTDGLALEGLAVFQRFAWAEGGASAGAVAGTEGRAGVHPHWLFHFPVAAVGPAVARVRAAGGFAFEPLTLPSGARVAVCDDPQGAAFALCEGSLAVV